MGSHLGNPVITHYYLMETFIVLEAKLQKMLYEVLNQFHVFWFQKCTSE